MKGSNKFGRLGSRQKNKKADGMHLKYHDDITETGQGRNGKHLPRHGQGRSDEIKSKRTLENSAREKIS